MSRVNNAQPFSARVPDCLPCAAHTANQGADTVAGSVNHVIIPLLHAVGTVLLRDIAHFVGFR